ncbi:MAG: enoyl-CoA hydratase family protein [Gemmatimonadaceae bacterium]|nr:enoyl-CoA hydratase family protein [Gemmatimonadaceae bacterium]
MTTSPRLTLAGYAPAHFRWSVEDGVGTITLDRPERKNPLTFESYAELTSLFRSLVHAGDVQVVVVTGAGENFCSGGDVHEIIGPLVEAKNGARTADLLAFTRMTGGLVAAMRACPQPIVAAVDGVCAGAGAIMAMASDVRLATERARTAFLFVRVGLSGADMGACQLLPRIVGLGRAAELLYTGRFMSAEEGERWGFYNRLVSPESLQLEALALARLLADGPTFAHGVTKACLNVEATMSLEAALEHEAQAQAVCMTTNDFERAYRAFIRRAAPKFEGN